jgi:hypothetical protein
MMPSRTRFFSYILTAAAIAVLGISGALIYLRPEPEAAPPTSRAPLPHAGTPASGPPHLEKEQTIRSAAISTLTPAMANTTSSAPITLHEAEAHYAQALDADAREDAARQLASLNTPASLQVLQQLFLNARRYQDRVAIVGALTDSQGSETLEMKFAILRLALAPGQPKPVRSTALDVAAQLEGSHAVTLLREAAKHDPDTELREFAKAALPSE